VDVARHGGGQGPSLLAPELRDASTEFKFESAEFQVRRLTLFSARRDKPLDTLPVQVRNVIFRALVDLVDGRGLCGLGQHVEDDELEQNC